MLLNKENPLKNLDILLAEDEVIIAYHIKDMLGELGCISVRHTKDIFGAVRLFNEKRPNMAILDVNLGNELVYPFATRLDEANVPFLFSTGHINPGLPAPWLGRMIIHKPFTRTTLESALVPLLAPAPDGPSLLR